MEKKGTIFDYLSQVLIVFGFAMLMLNIFCLLFGDSARGFSGLFELGSKGVPAGIAFQFLCVSALIVGIRIVFFTDILIKKMSSRLRTLCMLTAVVTVIAAFVRGFDWFPTDMWQPWAMFFVCFGLSFLGSFGVMSLKERAENRRMEEALQRWKEKEGGKK